MKARSLAELEVEAGRWLKGFEGAEKNLLSYLQALSSQVEAIRQQQTDIPAEHIPHLARELEMSQKELERVQSSIKQLLLWMDEFRRRERDVNDQVVPPP